MGYDQILKNLGMNLKNLVLLLCSFSDEYFDLFAIFQDIYHGYFIHLKMARRKFTFARLLSIVLALLGIFVLIVIEFQHSHLRSFEDGENHIIF